MLKAKALSSLQPKAERGQGFADFVVCEADCVALARTRKKTKRSKPIS